MRDEYGYLTGYQVDHMIPAIMRVDIETGKIETVREEAEKGQFSHDGRYLAFINYDHRYFTSPGESFHMRDLAVEDLKTGNVAYLTYGQYRILNFCFSADDRFIFACMKSEDENSLPALYRIPLQGGKPEKLSPSLGNGSGGDMQCSADGNWIICSDRKPDGLGILYLNLENESQRRKPLPASVVNVSLSPDGARFCSVVESDGPDPEYQLFISSPQAIPSGVETVSPVAFSIRGNFPNPFNQSTVIEYTLPESGNISLEVYNIVGQKIRQLESGIMSPGLHRARWDGRTDGGAAVSSGTYFVRLAMGKRFSTRNVTLVK
jgi:hypothetical protein